MVDYVIKKQVVFLFLSCVLLGSLAAQESREPLPLFDNPVVEFWDSGNHGGPEDPVVRQVQENHKPRIYSLGWSPEGHWCYFWVNVFNDEMGFTVLNTIDDKIQWEDARKIPEVRGAVADNTQNGQIMALYQKFLNSTVLSENYFLELQTLFTRVFETYGLDLAPGAVWTLPFEYGDHVYKAEASAVEEFYKLQFFKDNRGKQISMLPRYEEYFSVENHLRLQTAIKSPYEERVVLLVEVKDYESQYTASWYIITVGAHLKIGYSQ